MRKQGLHCLEVCSLWGHALRSNPCTGIPCSMCAACTACSCSPEAMRCSSAMQAAVDAGTPRAVPNEVVLVFTLLSNVFAEENRYALTIVCCSLTRLAAFVSGQTCVSVETTQGYSPADFRIDLKKIIQQVSFNACLYTQHN